ncbi:MAG: hypothetical protein ACI4Q4_07175 [Oscillospiraceae bacterium]
MEIIVGIVLCVILLLCAGAEWGFVVTLLLGAMGAALALLAAGFLVCIVLVLCSERVTAVFSEIRERENGGFPQVWYSVGEEQFPNAFPCEVVFRDKIYVRDKPVKVRLLRRLKLVFDKNAVAAMIVGVVFCTPSAAVILHYVAAALV